MDAASSAMKWMLEPLIDLIHGDIILQDPCSRQVAASFLHANDMDLRRLIAARELPSRVRKAVEVYCVRGFLVRSPICLQNSPGVAPRLMQLAEACRAAKVLAVTPMTDAEVSSIAEVGTADALLHSAGAMILTEVAILQQLVPEEERAAHLVRLIDALGDAVVAHLLLGTQQCAQELANYLYGGDGTTISVTQVAYHDTLRQFAVAVAINRESRANAQEVEVQRLLFGDEAAAVAASTNASPPALPRQSASPPPAQHPRRSPGRTFSQEVAAAMEDRPTVVEAPPHHLLKHAIPGAPAPRPARTLQRHWSGLHDDLSAMEDEIERWNGDEEEDAGDQDTGIAPVADRSTLVIDSSPATLSSLEQEGQDLFATPLTPPLKQPRPDPILIGATQATVRSLRIQGSSSSSCSGERGEDNGVTAQNAQQLKPVVGLVLGETPPLELRTDQSITMEPATDPWSDVLSCLQTEKVEARVVFSMSRHEPL